eukprot:316610_1
MASSLQSLEHKIHSTTLAQPLVSSSKMLIYSACHMPVVIKVEIGADTKAVQHVLNAVEKVAPSIAFMGFSAEKVNHGKEGQPMRDGKLLCFAQVSSGNGWLSLAQLIL